MQLSKQEVNSTRVSLFLGFWIAMFCEGVPRILLPLYFYAEGFPIVSIGVFFTCSEIAGCFGSLVGGYFTDRVGNKMVFVGSLMIHSLASFGYLCLDMHDHFSKVVVLICVFRVMRGVARELTEVSSSSFVKLISNKKKDIAQIQFLYGGKEMIRGGSFFIGGIMLEFLSFKLSFLILGTVSLVAGLYCLFSLPSLASSPSATQLEPLSFKGLPASIKRLSFARLLLYAGREVWITLAIPVYLSSRGMEQLDISQVMAVSLLLFGLAQPLFYYFLKRKIIWKSMTIKRRKWKYRPLLVWCVALVTIQLLVTWLCIKWGDPQLFILSIYAFNILNGMATVAHNHLHIKFSEKKRPGASIALYKLCSNLGRLLGVSISPYIYDLWGLNACIVFAIAFNSLSGLIGVGLQKANRNAKP